MAFLFEFTGRHAEIFAEKSGQMAGIVKAGLLCHRFELKSLPEQGRCVADAVPYFKFGKGHAVDLAENVTEPACAQGTGISRFPKGDLTAVLEKIQRGNQFLVKLERCFRQIFCPDVIQQFGQHVLGGKPAMKF